MHIALMWSIYSAVGSNDQRPPTSSSRHRVRTHPTRLCENTMCLKNAPTFTSCSFDKHGLILIIFGTQHRWRQRKFQSDSVHVAPLETAGIITDQSSLSPYCRPISHGTWGCLAWVQWGPRSRGSALLVVGFSVLVSISLSAHWTWVGRPSASSSLGR